jgi:outer membrane protein assembly factor BamD
MRVRLAALFLILLLASCAHRVAVKVIPIYTAEDEFERAKNLLDRKKYDNAATAFEQFTYNHQGSTLLPDAIYYQGESRFLDRNYSEAIAPFERVVTEYPNSSYADRAQYRLGLCYFKESPSWELDQEMTDKAIEAFRIFLIKYPQSTLVPEVNRMIAACQDKLAHKAWDAGRVYLTLKLQESARIYFTSTIQDYPASFWARKAALGLAECDFMDKKYTEAKAGYESLVKDPDARIRKQAEIRLKDIAKRQVKEPSQSQK